MGWSPRGVGERAVGFIFRFIPSRIPVHIEFHLFRFVKTCHPPSPLLPSPTYANPRAVRPRRRARATQPGVPRPGPSRPKPSKPCPPPLFASIRIPGKDGREGRYPVGRHPVGSKTAPPPKRCSKYRYVTAFLHRPGAGRDPDPHDA